MKALVVFSGGMDSATALVHCVKLYGADQVEAVSFNYGSKHNRMEWKHGRRLCKELGVKSTRVHLNMIQEHFKSDLLKSGGDVPHGHYADESMKRTVVPFRNGIMLSIAAGLAESREIPKIILGNHFGDHAIYPDCRADFAHHLSQAIFLGTYLNIELECPFQEWTKDQIAYFGARALDMDYSKTYSCYEGQEVHCGQCGTCVERKEAFQLAGLVDPTRYKA